MGNSREISVIIADDQILFLESLSQILSNRCDDISVKGLAHNGKEVISLVEKHNPQIVLMDIQMPIMNGVDATRLIHKKWPHIKIMVLTTFDDDSYIFDALKVGASGYILKNLPPDEIINCIRALDGGASQLSHQVAEKIIKKPHVISENLRESKPMWFVKMKKVDRNILKLLCDGYSIKEIADRVYLAEQTVKNHLSNIYGVMEVSGRSDAINEIMIRKLNVYL